MIGAIKDDVLWDGASCESVSLSREKCGEEGKRSTNTEKVRATECLGKIGSLI